VPTALGLLALALDSVESKDLASLLLLVLGLSVLGALDLLAVSDLALLWIKNDGRCESVGAFGEAK
jgi:hypothetical protein